jgi:hypothetical protein
MDHEKFWRLTWYEWSLYVEGYVECKIDRDKELADLKAHIANCTAPKKQGYWEPADFERLRSKTDVPERKLTMKEAKKLLGSTWKLPPHAK